RPSGNRAGDHGRRVRRRDALGDDPGRIVQAHRQARFPHGADPPSLRAQGLEGKPGRCALLDRHDASRALRPFDVETALAMTLKNRRVVVLGLGVTGLSAARWAARRGARVAVADTRADPPCAPQLRAELPQVGLTTGPITDATLADAQMIVISPGLAKEAPAIRAAVARGVELVGDVELFARALPAGQKVLA